MRPLEAARALSALDPFVNIWSHSGNDFNCYACDAPVSTAHESDCPVPMLPQIVAVLEVAERLKEQHDRGAYAEDLEGDLTELSAALKGESA